MTRKYASAWNRTEPGKASICINKFKCRMGDRFVLYVRVSDCSQNKNGNLRDQIAQLLAAVEDAGGIVIDVITDVCSGYTPIRILYAAHIARKHGATLLAEATDRFVRSPAFHSKTNPTARARRTDIESLMLWTDGVKLMTLIDPDAALAEVRSCQTKRGMQQKGRMGGRPDKPKPGDKKRFREVWRSKVLRLHRKGWSQRAIAKCTPVPRTTIRNWVAAADQGWAIFRNRG